MGKPTRCIDPVLKFCQDCEYGVCIYAEDEISIEGASFETHCIYGLEDTEPTEEEIKEFDDWVNEQHQKDIKELYEENQRLTNDFAEYRDLVGNIIKTQEEIRSDAIHGYISWLRDNKRIDSNVQKVLTELVDKYMGGK